MTALLSLTTIFLSYNQAQSECKFNLFIPAERGFVLDLSRHHIDQLSNEISYLFFLRSSSKSSLSVDVGLRRSPRSKQTIEIESDPLFGYLNDRRGLPSKLSIGLEGWTPRGVSGSMKVVARFENASAQVTLHYTAHKEKGKPRFNNETWDEDIALVESLARQAMSIAVRWKLAGVGSSIDAGRESLIERGYVRLGPWMTSKGFTVTWDPMKRMATFTKGNQTIKLAEGSREGFDGSVRKDHGSLIVGLNGELWAKTSQLSSWIN
ncbi:MAG TPA: hypothetical protein PLO61_01550 [Fimbriimonadaceae bacterium]|nr:hypothetical protein [Fimbriimonadaceae bacterium]HRJ32214.1 hypothetical protein [Fimbriimonadaceae bacterium]